MARRLPSWADRRDLFLVISLLTLMLGFGLVGAVFIGSEPFPVRGMAALTSPARATPTVAAAISVMGPSRVGITPVCHPGRLLASHSGSLDLAPAKNDPREYLSKMAALRFRHRLITPIALDPYQASLNPGVYRGAVAISATPLAPTDTRRRD